MKPLTSISSGVPELTPPMASGCNVFGFQEIGSCMGMHAVERRLKLQDRVLEDTILCYYTTNWVLKDPGLAYKGNIISLTHQNQAQRENSNPNLE
jgi:hypothetical protein